MILKKLLSNNLLFVLIIWIGFFTFLVFFFLGTTYYPGGSNENPQSIGFNWFTNYWSELLNGYAKNGKQNPAQPYALTGGIAFAVTLSLFWMMIPLQLRLAKRPQRIIQISGLLSMVCSILIYGQAHDIFITMSVTFGSISFILLLNGLWKTKLIFSFFGGFTCLLLIILNTTVYMTNWGIEALPVLQKITFLYGIIWTVYTAQTVSSRHSMSTNG